MLFRPLFPLFQTKNFHFKKHVFPIFRNEMPQKLIPFCHLGCFSKTTRVFHKFSQNAVKIWNFRKYRFLITFLNSDPVSLRKFGGKVQFRSFFLHFFLREVKKLSIFNGILAKWSPKTTQKWDYDTQTGFFNLTVFFRGFLIKFHKNCHFLGHFLMKNLPETLSPDRFLPPLKLRL